MKGIVLSRFGDAEKVIEPKTLPDPPPGPGALLSLLPSPFMLGWKARAAKLKAPLALKPKQMKTSMNTKWIGLHCSAIVLMLAAATSQARSNDIITTHSLSAALAAEAVTEAVASCARQGFRVSAAVLNIDGLTQAILRGDGAHAATFDLANDKAYTAITLGATHNEDSTSAIVKRMGSNPNAFWGSGNVGGLGRLPRISLIPGGLRIKVGNEVIGAIGVSGAPGIDDDESCANAGIDRIRARLK